MARPPASATPASPRRKKAAKTAKAAAPRARARKPALATRLTVADLDELEALRAQIEHASRQGTASRWNADPEDVHRSVARLVLTLVEFIRKLLERQAIRRMEAGTLTEAETEDVGRALMLLEATMRELTLRFGLRPEDLNLDLGPLGRMM